MTRHEPATLTLCHKPDPDLASRARTEALDAELALLTRRTKRATNPERAGLDQARAAQQGVLRFVDDLFSQRGFSFLFASDLDEVGRLLKDALQTALILLPSDGLHFEDPRWNAIRGEVESLTDSLDYVLESRARVAAELAAGDGLSLELAGPHSEAA